MHPYFSSEVNSSDIPSDNPIFQRTKKAYDIVAENHLGRVLEVGCGEGYGIPTLLKNASSYVGIDKNRFLISKLKKSGMTNATFVHQRVPPLDKIPSESVDTVVCFQVVEHILEAQGLISESLRVLTPGGKLYVTTPNAIRSVSRNPWHVKEYTGEELGSLLVQFAETEIHGLVPNQRAEEYYAKSLESTRNIVRMDLLNFSRWLPSPLLYLPYEILNRVHRKTLQRKYPKLVEGIGPNDYELSDDLDSALDLFAIATK